MPRASSSLTAAAVILLAAPVRADPVLLVASPEIAAPLARALGDAGLEPAPEAPAEAASRAPEILADATRAFAAMEPALALRDLDRARAELDRTGGGTGGPAEAARAELLSALALAASGQPQAEVDRALRQALALSPDLAIDPVEYPPWLRDRVGGLAGAPLPTAALELRGAPGADAFVDGTHACVLPCARSLPVGVHRIRVERAGRLPFARRVDLTAATVVDVALSPDVAALARSVRGAVEVDQAPEEALSAFDRVLWATLRRGEDGARTLEGTLFAEDAGRRRATVAISDAGEAALEHACRALVSTLTTSPVVGEPRARRRRPRASAWYERPWVWIATGAAVVAGGIGLALAASAGPDDRFDAVLEHP